ncbi:MAG TPA: hypothetical protein VN924_32790 [Bryobacteraceae bacterium]|nr:hypothetical protein [Bryobacteraceae bacterium]
MTRLAVLSLLACALLEAQNPTLQQFMGTGLLSGTYVSGATGVSGSGTCNLSGFNGGGSGAQATVAVSGSAIANWRGSSVFDLWLGLPVACHNRDHLQRHCHLHHWRG